MFQDEVMGEPVLDVKKLLTEHIRSIFGGPELQASTVAETELPSDKREACTDGNGRSRQWKVLHIAIGRALARIASQTAQGLDGIPAGLVKCLGKNAKEYLAAIFT